MRFLVTSLALALSFPAAAKSHDPKPPKVDKCGDLRNVDDITEKYLEVINAGDVSAFDTIFTDDYVNHLPIGTVEGLPAFAGLMEGVYNAFPDITYQMDQVLVDGDYIIYRYSWTGTHQGEFFGVPATGRVVHGSGMEVDLIDGDLIAETWNYADFFGIMSQISAP